MRSKSLKVLLVASALFVLSAGANLLLAGKGGGSGCPSSTGCGCTTAYAPVLCAHNCRYTNSCHARCAGATNCKSIDS